MRLRNQILLVVLPAFLLAILLIALFTRFLLVEHRSETTTLVLFVLGLVTVLILSLFLGIVIFDRQITRRIIGLSRQMGSIKAHNASAQLPVTGEDEIAQLTHSVNQMLQDLQDSEGALNESERRYRSIVEGQSEWVCRWRPTGEIVFANKAFQRYFIEGSEGNSQNFRQLFAHARPDWEEQLGILRQERSEQSCQRQVGLPLQETHWQLWIDQPQFDPNGELIEILSVGRDITAQMDLETQLRRRVDFERLVTMLSFRFVNLYAGDLDKVINEALEMIGGFVDVDRSYIFFFDFENQLMRYAYEWCAPGIQAQILLIPTTPLADMPWWMQKMSRLENIYIPSVAAMPPEAEKERAILQLEDIKSLLCVPMVSRGDLIGFMGFDSVRSEEEWSDESIQLLNLAANIIASALDRIQADQRLMAQQRRLRLLNEITEAALHADKESQLFEKSADILIQFVHADACLIHANHQINCTVVCGVDAEELEAQLPKNFLNELINILPSAGGYLSVEMVKDAPAEWFGLREKYHTVYGMPLVTGELDLGVVLLFFCEDPHFNENERNILNQTADQVALGTLKIRGLSDAQQRLAEAETLREAGRVIASTLSPEEAADRILDQLKRVVHYDSASVQLLVGDCLEIVGGRGWDDPKAVLGMRFPVPGDNPNSVVIQTGEPYMLENAPKVNPNFRRSPHDHIHSWLGAPLIVHGDVIGMLAVDKKETGFFQEEHIQLVTAFADQVAVSFENARLFASEHQKALELEALRATVRDITAELELSNLLQALVERSTRLLDATGGELALYDEDLLRLRVMISLNLGIDFTGEIIEIGEGVMGQAAKTLQPQVVEDYSHWDQRIPIYERAKIHAALAAPLLVGGRLLGVIGVGSSDPARRYSQSDLNLLNLFAQQAAIAVENARLFDEIQTQAITDELTGMYNRRGLFELGQPEIERAARHLRPISVLLFDIDHFKQVNDLHSHAVGDQVLRHLAVMCRGSLRKTDILGRYGGEKFAVLLLETGPERALIIAERFRSAVETTLIETSQGPLWVTVSCGVTSAFGDIPELRVLLDQADTALYVAKQSGRNQTRCFDEVKHGG